MCIHPARVAVDPWLKCPSWILSGRDPPIATPTRSPGPAWSGFPPADRRLAAVCKALSAREAAAPPQLGRGHRRAQGLPCHCAENRAGTPSSRSLWPCRAADPANLPSTNAVRPRIPRVWVRAEACAGVRGPDLLQLRGRPLGAAVPESPAGTERSAARSWGALGL